MAFEGMDVGEVQNLGHQLQQRGGDIDHLITSITAAVDHLLQVWHGKDATEFHGWWTNQHRPALQSASEAVKGLGQAALNNAQEQENVSSH